MQKLTYINILGESLVFFRDGPYIFRSIRGTGPSGLVITTLQGVYQGGDTTVGIRRQHREVDFVFHIEGQTREEMYTLRRQLCGLLSAGKAFDGINRARIMYENDSGRWWTWAIPETGPDFDNRIRNFLTDIPITFRCESPYWYSPTQSNVLLAYSGEGFSLPFDFPIAFGSQNFSREVRNEGQVAAPVEIIIEGQGETPALINHDTGAKMQLISPLPAGSTLAINTDPAMLTATVTDSEGNTQSAFGLLSVESPLTAFTLRPGLNRLEYLPGGTAALSRITVRWYELYEGV